MLAMWTSTKIKNTRRTQMIPLHTRRWNLPFFCPCQISGLLFLSWQKLLPKRCLWLPPLVSFSGLIKIDCKQHIPLCIQSLDPGVRSLVEGAIKEWSPASGHDEFWFMDLLKTTGVMPGDLGDFLGTSGYETWTGSSWCFDSFLESS